MVKTTILVNKILYTYSGSWNTKKKAQDQGRDIRKSGGRAVVRKSTKQGIVKYLVYSR